MLSAVCTFNIDPGKLEKALKETIVDKLTLVGEAVTTTAKEKSPYRTGDLRDDIHYVVDEKECSVKIGTNKEYAPYLEFGTGDKAENGKGRPGWPGIKPQPFLRPAILENKDKIEAILNK